MLIASIQAPIPLVITSQTTQQQIQQWITHQQHPVTITQIGASTHYRSLQHGWEIEVARNTIQTFFAYFRTAKMAVFEGRLKAGVRPEWTIKAAVMVLGEPATKSSKMVELIYPQVGIGLVFQGTWNNENSPIDYAYFFPPEPIPLCSSCAKTYPPITQPLRCPCGLVCYCSEECRKKHFGHHLIFCEEGQP